MSKMTDMVNKAVQNNALSKRLQGLNELSNMVIGRKLSNAKGPVGGLARFATGETAERWKQGEEVRIRRDRAQRTARAWSRSRDPVRQAEGQRTLDELNKKDREALWSRAQDFQVDDGSGTYRNISDDQLYQLATTGKIVNDYGATLGIKDSAGQEVNFSKMRPQDLNRMRRGIIENVRLSGSQKAELINLSQVARTSENNELLTAFAERANKDAPYATGPAAGEANRGEILAKTNVNGYHFATGNAQYAMAYRNLVEGRTTEQDYLGASDTDQRIMFLAAAAAAKNGDHSAMQNLKRLRDSIYGDSTMRGRATATNQKNAVFRAISAFDNTAGGVGSNFTTSGEFINAKFNDFNAYHSVRVPPTTPGGATTTRIFSINNSSAGGISTINIT